MRPTKYCKKVQAKADWYAEGGYLDCGDAVPSQAGLACELSVTRQTLVNWKEQHPKFLDTLDLISVVQERLSLSGGLKGEMNSAIVKLLLANHGYSEKKALHHNVSEGLSDNHWTVKFVNADFPSE
ncbi:DNA-packaging protein [Brumicola nitratireducens]|uniref:Bacteriophage protein n=1 Tax=Glaciecola nitratireducens (strain JCM 12485 / KCTC 12276 / FR1064) TaxID=1085623 RepID=G4QH90_GLANF|nr:DNA-packaging protein [Glaciecola nitratireducens]AEP29721.1 bacteriophage protein [Glaciecola nitratireducens FR1064]